MEKLVSKLKEQEGSSPFQMITLFLVGMCLFSIVFEVTRVTILVRQVRSAYENAIRTVVTENYNEVFAGFREEEYIGGQYIGGSEGGGEEELPVWEELHDTGDVEEELVELLGLEDEGKMLKKQKAGYSLSGFHIEVKNGQDSELGRYEVNGKVCLNVSFAVGWIAVGHVEIPLRVQTKYGENF